MDSTAQWNTPASLRTHNIRLPGERVVLRPMTEDDWEILLRWNSDPKLLYFSDDNIGPHDISSVQHIYRSVSQKAFCFILEVEGVPIGEGWLQQMNMDRIIQSQTGKDLRRIDLMIGEKALWGKGFGTDTIRTLTRFGFDVEKADIIFGLVGGHNPRSRRAFEKSGYRVVEKIENPVGSKSKYDYDLAITREEYCSEPCYEIIIP